MENQAKPLPPTPLDVSLWIAVAEYCVPVSKEVRQKAKGTGIIPGGEIKKNEYRFLAQDFADAVRIAQEQARDGETIIEVVKASHVFQTGDYWVIKNPNK
jgi:hypothetical protein